MRFRRSLSLALSVFAVLVAPTGRPYFAVAQTAIPQATRPSSGPILITAVTPSEPSPSESRVVLSFNQLVPEFSIIGNDANIAVMAFADTKLVPNLLFPGGKHGLVQSMTFTQNGSMLMLNISGAGPIHVGANILAGRAISVSITGVGAASAKPDADVLGVAVHADGHADDVFEIVPLKYADVSEVVGLLTANQSIKPNDDFTPQEPAFGSAGMQGSYAGAGLSTPTFNQGFSPLAGGAGSVGQTVDDTIGIDRRLNAIILRGPSARVARLKEKIAKLDVAVNSVVLETVFVELTETGARNVGLDFNNANNQIASVSYSLAQGEYPGINNTARTGGVTLSLQAAIYAQIAKGNGRIISKPRIAAQSGSTAKIITGDALPILTSIALSGVNAVQQQVQYVNVGVTLQIAPRVSNDGFVTSHVFAEVSSVTGISQGYPTISQREASTSATVRDGESFVIGGLTQESELSHHDKFPGIGDVPLLGELFKSENTNRSKTDLYIVVTPHVVRGRDAGAALLQQSEAGKESGK
jgi:general secretion pathway protein D